MANIFGYMRISTKESSDKQSFNRQEKALEKYAEENKIKYHTIYKDDFTGSTFKRENWEKLESILQLNDTIIFKDVSRFTREAVKGYEKYIELMNKGINLIFLDNLTISTDYIKSMMRVSEEQDLVTKTALEGTIKLLLIVELDRVEKERELIVKRIKQGLEASEKTSGRKQGSILNLTDDLKKDIISLIGNRTISKSSVAEKHGVSRTTLDKYIKIVLQEIWGPGPLFNLNYLKAI